MKLYTLHFDGSCGPKNPGGTAGYGFVLTCNGAEVERGRGVIGSGLTMSNNLAEFVALDKGLQAFRNHAYPTPSSFLHVYGDSQIVIKIMSRAARANPGTLYYPAYMDTLHTLAGIRRDGHVVSFDWIPRENNTECDVLSKECVTVT